MLEEMRGKGIEPNGFFHSAMVVAHSAAGDVDSAMSVLEGMRDHGQPASRDVFHALIRQDS